MSASTAVARQQHRFDRLAVGLQFGVERGQGLAHRLGQEVDRPAPAAVVGGGPRPVAQHALLVQRLRAERAQARPYRVDLRRV